MPTNQVLRTAGKIAGLSGLALAVFLLIFQGVIQFGLRGAISSLSPASSFAVLNSLMSFTFGIAAIGLIAALIGALVYGLIHRPSPQTAAVKIDQVKMLSA